MNAMDKYLSEVMLEKQKLRLVEPHIYSIAEDELIENEYDTGFGSIYEWVACNPIYNRVMWGYSTAKFATFVQKALTTTTQGSVLDLGCGSLSFTAQTYAHYRNRPVGTSHQTRLFWPQILTLFLRDVFGSEDTLTGGSTHDQKRTFHRVSGPFRVPWRHHDRAYPQPGQPGSAA